MASRTPRGRLPQRVYWFRRAMVLVVAAALVFGIGKLIGTGSDQPADQASTTASTAKTSGSSASAGAPLGPAVPEKLHVRATQAPLLPPSGECAADEVSVLPAVPKAAAGGPIALALRLEGTQPACTFKVSPDSLVVKITSGADRIWSSQDCPGSIHPSTVVVRSGVPAVVPVAWTGRRSDDDCSHLTQWALPGFYHVYAAALGSTPTDVQFEVTIPNRRLVTRTAKAKPTAKATPKATAKPGTKASAKPRPTAGPTKKTGGKGTTCGGDNAAGTC